MELLSWLYDIRMDSDGIRFVLFRRLTAYQLRFENIEIVREVGRATLGALTAYNFKNRFLGRTFLLELKRGWFSRKVLVTPAQPDAFLDMLKTQGIPVMQKEPT